MDKGNKLNFSGQHIYVGMDVHKKSCAGLSEHCFKLTNLINGFIRYLRTTDRKE